MRYDLRFTLSENDFLDFQKCYFEHSDVIRSGIKKQRIIMAIAYPVLAAGCYFWFRGFPGIVGASAAVVIGSLSLILMRRRFLKRTLRQARKMVANGRGKSILGPKRLLVDENSMTLEEESGVTRMLLSKIYRVRESDACVFLFRDEMSGFIIPKATFSGRSDVRGFVTFFQESIKGGQVPA